jgi:hypothetical protein
LEEGALIPGVVQDRYIAFVRTTRQIYAVLNLAQDGDKIVPQPDYSLPIRDIYKLLVVSMVKQTGRLDVLSLAGLPVCPRKLDINLPTWAPDWSYRVAGTINSSIGDVNLVWADRQSSTEASFHSDSNIVKAKGFIVDTVDGLAQHDGLIQYIGGLESTSPTMNSINQLPAPIPTLSGALWMRSGARWLLISFPQEAEAHMKHWAYSFVSTEVRRQLR